MDSNGVNGNVLPVVSTSVDESAAARSRSRSAWLSGRNGVVTLALTSDSHGSSSPCRISRLSLTDLAPGLRGEVGFLAGDRALPLPFPLPDFPLLGVSLPLCALDDFLGFLGGAGLSAPVLVRVLGASSRVDVAPWCVTTVS